LIRISLLALLLASIVGCASGSLDSKAVRVDQSDHKQVSGIDADEYSVYSALLAKLYTQSLPIVIDQPSAFVFGKSDLDATLKYVSQNTSEGIAPALLDDFKRKNSEKENLTNRFDSAISVDLITKEEADRLYENSGWARFLETHPHGAVVTFSRVGFMPDRKQALVYTGIQSGGKSGSGYYVVLTNERSGWQIKSKVEVWVS